MNILFISDIVGKPGRHAVHQVMKKVKAEHSVDFTIANGENSAGGSGIAPEQFHGILDTGVDVITSGNHTWSKKDVLQILDKDPRLLRPHNYPIENPGTGVGVFDCKGTPIAVLNLMGRVFMYALDCPFKAADRAISEIGDKARIIFVDMHAEATSEKRCMGWYLDGRVSAVIGTHTHIQTADEEILPGGTAYLTDAGMCGSPNSAIGVKKELALKKFLLGAPVRFEVSEEMPYIFQGVVVSVEPSTGKALKIVRIQEWIR
jgi:2',3'-cyclic-nucleotide 2'-phosphodiesterase